MYLEGGLSDFATETNANRGPISTPLANPPEPPLIDDIVVVGVRSDLTNVTYTYSGYNFYYLYWSGGVGNNFPGGYPNYIPGASNSLTGMFDQYSIDVIDTLGRPKTPDEAAAIEILKKAKTELNIKMISGDLPNKSYSNELGEKFTTSDLTLKWIMTDFAITDKQYTNGGEGETHASKTSLDVFLEINIGGLIAYTGGPASTTPWVTEQQRVDYAIAYILHEQIHATNAGLDRSSTISLAEQNTTNPKWIANEGFAWAGANAVLIDMGKGGLPFTPLQPMGPAFTSTPSGNRAIFQDDLFTTEESDSEAWPDHSEPLSYALQPETASSTLAGDWFFT